jgi:hypothetical protein
MVALLLLLLVLACLVGGFKFSRMGCAWAIREYRRQDGWRPAPDPVPFPPPAASRAPEPPTPRPPLGRGRGGPGPEATEPGAGLAQPLPAGAGEEGAIGATAKAAQEPAVATAGPANWAPGRGRGGRAIQPRSGGAVGFGR